MSREHRGSEVSRSAFPSSITDRQSEGPILVTVPHLDGMLGRHSEALLRLVTRIEGEDEIEPVLTHYTTQGAAQGILSTGEIWATDPRYLNDELEMLYFLEPLEQAYSDLLPKARDARSGSVLDALGTALFDVDVTEYQTAETYVACFCSASDLLSQWRGYGGVSGPAYSLSFTSDDMVMAQAITEAQPAAHAPPVSVDTRANVTLLKVRYASGLQRRWLRDYLEPTVDLFLETAEVLSLKRARIRECARYVADALLVDLLNYAGVAFKSWGFREESEWRLVVRVPEGVPSGPPAFRPTNLGLAPYRRVRLFDYETGSLPRRLPLFRVTQGPTKEPELGITSMRRFLDVIGYSGDVPVVRSSLSYRS